MIFLWSGVVKSEFGQYETRNSIKSTMVIIILLFMFKYKTLLTWFTWFTGVWTLNIHYFLLRIYKRLAYNKSIHMSITHNTRRFSYIYKKTTNLDLIDLKNYCPVFNYHECHIQSGAELIILLYFYKLQIAEKVS